MRCVPGCAVLFCATAGLALEPYHQVTLSGSTAIVKNTSGTQVYSCTNHQAAIQWAMDNLPAGRTTKAKVLVTGDYTNNAPILFSSYTCLALVGKITLANHADCIVVEDKSITATETDIELIGGIYDGNKYNQAYSPDDPEPGFYCIRFRNVANSMFRDFAAQNMGKDGFILDEGCHDNICSNLVGRWSGYPDYGAYRGNGLGDRGDRNVWTDCLSTDNGNDSWVIKCRNSTFTRCIARNQATGAAFGLFGDRLIEGNFFYDCEAYRCKGRVLSLRKPLDASKGDDPIRNNYFEIYIHDNGDLGEEEEDQVAARLWSSRDPIDGQELIRDNELHLLVANNHREGLYIQESNVSGTTGTIVIYSNTVDAIVEGHDNNLTFLVPEMSKVSITNSGVNNVVNKRTISRSDTNTSWAARKYYQLTVASTGSGYDDWAATQSAVVGAPGVDYDEDGRNNLYEYALDGDPTDDQDNGVDPVFVRMGDGFEYSHLKRRDDASLIYAVETRTNLVSGVWTAAGDTVLGTNSYNAKYEQVRYRISTTRSNSYVRLKITRP